MDQDATSSFQAFDLASIKRQTFVVEIEAHDSIPSTNDRALSLAVDAQLPTPMLIIASRQTEGRGRGRKRWWTTTGGLTFSLIADIEVLRFPAERHSQLSLAVGVAVCETLHELIPDHHVGLKWPNDVYIDGRKVCGILVEVPPERNGRFVIGIGVNVNNSLADAPDELRKTATSLIDVRGSEFDLASLLVALLIRLEQRLESLSSRDPQLAARWEQFSILRGRTVDIESHSRTVSGVCQGIDEEGGLLLRTSSGIERIVDGIVRHFE